ncbi:hypothetical protein DFQ30_006275 [Apophysomyces sp. BC1015]|nr:hypothetical protein DFQ30_006275 [Apophysomyces sp. BC1015]KAG0177097.1 hypothetical protein DFQ29_005233 [Apophysomyces sp. BC1021]
MEIDRETLKEFAHLEANVPEAAVMYCPGVEYIDLPDAPGEDSMWVRDLYNEFSVIPQSELPAGASSGYHFSTFTASVPQYLAWLISQLTKLGGRLEQGEFKSLSELIDKYHNATIVVNCSGLGSSRLTDVKDTTMYPIRGQTVLVHAPHVKKQLYRTGKGYFTYIIPRKDGNVICGGTLDAENRSTVPDDELTKEILKRCYELYPDITHGKGPDAFDIVAVNVGFRPGRQQGIRIEKEIIRRPNNKKVVVCHNYGHGSHGYQSSWGSSARVLQLLGDNNDRSSKL